MNGNVPGAVNWTVAVEPLNRRPVCRKPLPAYVPVRVAVGVAAERPGQAGHRPGVGRRACRTVAERDAMRLVGLDRPLDAVANEDGHVTGDIDVAGDGAGTDAHAGIQG